MSLIKIESLTAYVLIAANLIPLVGVLFFDWSLPLIMVLYWLENIVIGAYTLLKMIVMMLDAGELQKLFSVAFFCIHYGLFCSAHGMILFGLLDIPIPNDLNTDILLLQPQTLFQFLTQTFGNPLLLGVIAIVLSHGFSMFEHFFQRRERDLLTFNNLMASPYPRIVILHVAIIAGAMLVESLGSPTYLLFALVVMKIIMDVKLHMREHAKNVMSPIKDI